MNEANFAYVEPESIAYNPEAHRVFERFMAEAMSFIQSAWRQAETTPVVALCKEPRFICEALGLNHSHCNCE